MCKTMIPLSRGRLKGVQTYRIHCQLSGVDIWSGTSIPFIGAIISNKVTQRYPGSPPLGLLFEVIISTIGVSRGCSNIILQIFPNSTGENCSDWISNKKLQFRFQDVIGNNGFLKAVLPHISDSPVHRSIPEFYGFGNHVTPVTWIERCHYLPT